MSKPESKSENDATGTRLPSFILPTRPTGLPSDSHLRGLDNYAVWILQMETLVGNEGFKVMMEIERKEVNLARRQSGSDSTVAPGSASRCPVARRL